MTKTIERLWSGELEPVKYLGTDNSDLRRLEHLAERNFRKLNNSLNENQREDFKKFNDCIEEYIFLMNELAFCDGFSFGAKIVSEALNHS